MNIKCFDKYNKIFNFRLDPSVHIVFYKRLVQVKYGSVLEDWIRTRTRLSGEDAYSSAFIQINVCIRVRGSKGLAVNPVPQQSHQVPKSAYISINSYRPIAESTWWESESSPTRLEATARMLGLQNFWNIDAA